MFTIIHTSRFAIAIKRHWCRWYYLNEAGCIALQVGPFIVEIVHTPSPLPQPVKE